MIPGLILTKSLPLLRAALPYAIVVALILGGVWYISNSATMAERARQEAARAKAEREAEKRTQRIERALSGAVVALDGRIGSRIETLRTLRTTIIQPLQKELQIETRYRDPACSLSGSVLENLNRARAASGATPVAGDYSVTVPIGGDAE